MKKIVVLLALLFLFPGIVKAETFYAGNPVEEVPLYLDKISKQSYRYFKTAYRRSDNVLVYCVEPDKLLSVVDNYYPIIQNQEKALDISKEQWRRIELLSYFGYGYENHKSEKWAAITQYLIWHTVLPDGWFLTFTDGYGGDFKNIHQVYTDEIENLIKNFETTPSFQNEKFKITKNNNLILKDENNVLDNYHITSNSDLKVSIENNELHVSASKNGEYHLEFVRGEYVPTKLYLSDNNQAVVATDGVPEKRFSIDITVESGSIKIKRLIDNYLDNEGTNENAVYEIIDSNNNKQIMSTNSDGEIILKDLPIGELNIKELNPSIGYEKDTNEYKINIKNNSEVLLEIQPKLIKKQVNIIKKYLNDGENLLPNEKDAIFSVLKESDIKLTDKTNEYGKVTFLIPYGHYIISQNSTMINYELMKDYNIFIENSNEETLTFINYKKEPSKEEFVPDKEIEIEIPSEIIDIEENLPSEPDDEIQDEIIVNDELKEDIIERLPVSMPEESVQISNPKTGDNLTLYLIILTGSWIVLTKILRKMQ